MKKILAIIAALFLILAAFPMAASASNPVSRDIKIKVVNSFPDIRVKLVDAFPRDIGEWEIVDYGEDFTVEIVNSFPDVRVEFVDSFPGVE